MILTLDDVFNAVIWIQPVAWAVLLKVRNRFLDFTLFTAALVTLVGIIPLWSLVQVAPFIALLYFYIGVGFSFSLYLLHRGWRYTQAISVSALAVFVGGFLWEVPWLIRNAFITGPQGDWLLHVLRLYFIAFLGGYWRVNLRGVVLVALVLLASAATIIVYPLPPGSEVDDVNWNHWIIMLNRLFSTAVVFTLIRKDAKNV